MAVGRPCSQGEGFKVRWEVARKPPLPLTACPAACLPRNPRSLRPGHGSTLWHAILPMAMRLPRRRLLLELGDALGALSGKLCTALAELHGEKAALAQSYLEFQLTTAGPVLPACCALAGVVGLSGDQLARFARCGALLVGEATHMQLAGWHAKHALHMQRAARRQGAVQTAITCLEISTVPAQLHAANRLLGLLGRPGEKSSLAAFAASVWTSERLSCWLTAILDVIALAMEAGVGCWLQASWNPCLLCLASCARLLSPHPLPLHPLLPFAECHYSCIPLLAAVFGPVLTLPAFRQHQAAVQAEPALQLKLAALLPDLTDWASLCLEFGLPDDSASATGSSAAAGTGPFTTEAAAARTCAEVGCSLRLLTAPCLQGAVQQLLQGAVPGQQQWLEALTSLLQRLPAVRPSTLPVADFAQLLLQAVAAGAMPNSGVLGTAPDPSVPGASGGRPDLGALVASLRRIVETFPLLARALAQLLRDSELAAQLAAQPPAAVVAVCDKVRAAAGTAVGSFITLFGIMAMRAEGGQRGAAQDGARLVSQAATASLAAVELLHGAAELPLLANRVNASPGPAAAGAGAAASCLKLVRVCMMKVYEHCKLLQQGPAAREFAEQLQQQQVPAQLRLLCITARRLTYYADAATPRQLEVLPLLARQSGIDDAAGFVFRNIAELTNFTSPVFTAR